MTKSQHYREFRAAQAMKIRRNILAAQLRVALDTERKRETPEAVIRLSKLPIPEVNVTQPIRREASAGERHLTAAGD